MAPPAHPAGPATSMEITLLESPEKNSTSPVSSTGQNSSSDPFGKRAWRSEGRLGLRVNWKHFEFVPTLWVTCSKHQRNLRGPWHDLGEGEMWRIRTDPEPRHLVGFPGVCFGFWSFAS